MRASILGLTALALLAGCNTAPAPNPYTPISNRAASSEARQPYPERDPGLRRESRREARRQRGANGHGAETNAQAGAFDFYLLNLSWSPEFCATHGSSPECALHLGFVVHGLWPQNNDGTYPEQCSDAPGPANPQALTDLIPTASLVEHEWQTHGTCSGLEADAYFQQIRSARGEVKIPRTLQNVQSQAMVSPEDLLSQFAQANPGFPRESFALSCGNNYLTAIEVCMDRNLHPEACQSVRTCGAQVVKITPQ